FFSSRRRHTSSKRDWSSDVCSSDLLARKAAELAKSEKVDMILAVGGGSVLDSAKAAATGAYYDCDPWEFSSKKRVPEKALPVGRSEERRVGKGCGAAGSRGAGESRR